MIGALRGERGLYFRDHKIALKIAEIKCWNCSRPTADVCWVRLQVPVCRQWCFRPRE